MMMPLILKNKELYSRVARFCGSNVKSSSELSDFLDKALKSYRFENDTYDKDTSKDEVIKYFEDLRLVFRDEEFLDKFFQSISSINWYSYQKLYLKLSPKVSDKKFLKQRIQKYLLENELEEVKKLLKKSGRKIQHLSKPEIVRYLCSKGFSSEKCKKAIFEFM